jgi:hypothetical protein
MIRVGYYGHQASANALRFVYEFEPCKHVCIRLSYAQQYTVENVKFGSLAICIVTFFPALFTFVTRVPVAREHSLAPQANLEKNAFQPIKFDAMKFF